MTPTDIFLAYFIGLPVASMVFSSIIFGLSWVVQFLINLVDDRDHEEEVMRCNWLFMKVMNLLGYTYMLYRYENKRTGNKIDTDDAYGFFLLFQFPIVWFIGIATKAPIFGMIMGILVGSFFLTRFCVRLGKKINKLSDGGK